MAIKGEKKEKIIIRNDYLEGGGVENVLQNLTDYLAEEDRFDVTVVTDFGTYCDFHKSYHSRIHYVRSNILNRDYKVKSIKWFINHALNKIYRYCFLYPLLFRKWDIAIAMKEGPCMKEVCNLRADYKVGWVHVDYNYMHWTKRCFLSDSEELNCFSRFDHVVCVSQAVVDSVKNVIGNPGNLLVRYNPLNVGRIIEQSNYGIDDIEKKGKFTFVSVGRLTPQKNYATLIKACAVLEKQCDFELRIIGDGGERERLERMINDENVRSVQLLGNKSNPYPYIKNADVFISSSTCESFGLAVQEALILDTPVIAVRCPAVQETLDERFGILINNSVDDIVFTMKKIIDNPDLVHNYRKNIQNQYSKDVLYEDRLRKICELWKDRK